LGRYSAAVFFNAVRWLLQKRDLEPLYTLTSPYAPEPAPNRLVLHKDEGNTWRTPGVPGELTELNPLAGKGATIPLWPILLMAAAIVFLIERAVMVYRK
ncbi:MAG: hypothetical protein L0Y73_08690, partial [Candidatus Aminicenantes bacterium]|nr:hypothetical protein [Candidatus Aminicenantes bacterium]